jgi:hypothetical protein
MLKRKNITQDMFKAAADVLDEALGIASAGGDASGNIPDPAEVLEAACSAMLAVQSREAARALRHRLSDKPLKTTSVSCRDHVSNRSEAHHSR